MPGNFGDYLVKLRTIADGALTTLDRRRTTEVAKPLFTDAERQRNWWDGYRECAEVALAEYQKGSGDG